MLRSRRSAIQHQANDAAEAAPNEMDRVRDYLVRFHDVARDRHLLYSCRPHLAIIGGRGLMTSGRPLLPGERLCILRKFAMGCQKSKIAEQLKLDVKTVISVIDSAAIAYYRIARPMEIDDLPDEP